MASASKILKPATAEWYRSILTARKTWRKTRGEREPTVNVVSPNLCGVYCLVLSHIVSLFVAFVVFMLTQLRANLFAVDDILQRLSPSLKCHEHCDIIDINPGGGLWSSKLHEHLRPRAHILVEPLEEYYRPFLEPLLSQPDSKYRLADIKGLALESYEAILERSVLPHLKHFVPTASGSINNSLLLVANIAYPPRVAHQLRIPQSQKWLHQLLRMIRDKSGFHAYGLIRSLLWVLDEEKSVILPRSISNRQKLAAEIEICSTTEEVAGADAAAGNDRRLLSLDIGSAKRVAQAMQNRNIDTPEGRRSMLHEMVTEQAGQNVNDQGERTDPDRFTQRKWHDELEALKEDFKNGVFTEYVDQSTQGSDKRKSIANTPKANKARNITHPKRPKTAQWTRMIGLIYSIKAQRSQNAKADSIAIELADLDARQDALENCKLNEDERSLKRKEFEDKITQLQERAESRVKGFAKKVAFYADDRRAAQQIPPLLQWDRRSAEPLVVHDTEFHPKLPMALLDMQPRHVKTTPDFDLLLTSIFKRPSQPIGRTLDSLAPGAADALIPEIRGLRSRVNPGDFRPRVLTQEMIDDLFAAWGKWPFRPSLAKLWSINGEVSEDKIIYSQNV